jgi:hypothetical protein
MMIFDHLIDDDNLMLFCPRRTSGEQGERTRRDAKLNEIERNEIRQSPCLVGGERLHEYGEQARTIQRLLSKPSSEPERKVLAASDLMYKSYEFTCPMPANQSSKASICDS